MLVQCHIAEFMTLLSGKQDYYDSNDTEHFMFDPPEGDTVTPSQER